MPEAINFIIEEVTKIASKGNLIEFGLTGRVSENVLAGDINSLIQSVIATGWPAIGNLVSVHTVNARVENFDNVFASFYFENC